MYFLVFYQFLYKKITSIIDKHRSLKKEVAKFKSWAEKNIPLNKRIGEWECSYSYWPSLYHGYYNYFNSHTISTVSEEDIHDIIFAIARDNEDENLITEFGTRIEWLDVVLPYVLKSPEANAKWQFAVLLGDNVIPKKKSEPVLLKLFKDKDEYVSRRALESLGKINSSKTEKLCEKAWSTNHLYQRIMVLWVLHRINSNKLLYYLNLADSDDRQYLKENSIQIKNLMNEI